MMQQFLTISLLFTLSACAIVTASQTVASKNRSATPVLQLRIIPSKETYAPRESVITKTVFTNLSDKLLCFPKPEQGRQVAAQGYLAIQVVAPSESPEFEQFIEVIDGPGPWPREKLLSEIKERWIKLPPKETYTTEAAQVPATFGMPGQWQLKETYRPPEGSFQSAYREQLKSAALSVGCTLPDTPVPAEAITINIVSPPEKK
jgi:hypothetical protein